MTAIQNEQLTQEDYVAKLKMQKERDEKMVQYFK